MNDIRAIATASAELESRVGHPGDLWAALKDRVQAEHITEFATVESDWLRLMWAIDAFRIEGLPPRAMGRAEVNLVRRLGAVYRTKGNWFATLVALLLQNRTRQVLRPRTRVQGMSQLHQIDVAWPSREEDVLVCAETKVTGAPAFGDTPARGALADFSNRRKELKFAATDLKLYRRQQTTPIGHWAVWRENEPPKTYFLWAARLRVETKRPERIHRLVDEARALVDTYLDGAGIVCWRLADSGASYTMVPLPANAVVTSLDDVLYRIQSEIARRVGPNGEPPAPVIPVERAVDLKKLLPDRVND